MNRASVHSNCRGFSLVELMISIVLGLMMIAGAIATYLASQRSYTETEQYSALTDNARFAELTIADALLHAGFFGEATAMDMERGAVLPPAADCGGPPSSNGQGSADVYNFERYIFAATIIDSGKAQAEGIDLDCIDDGRVGTDVLIIKRAIPSPITDGARVDPVRDGELDTPKPPQAGTIYVLSNNIKGMLFDGGGAQPGILEGGEIYHGIAWPYLFEAYYVRDKDPEREDDPPTLARKTLVFKDGAIVLGEPEDLIEGVEDMQLQIGFDSDNDNEIDSYTDVADMANEDWARAGSMEVYLLVRSSKDPQYTDKKTYDMGGPDPVDAKDFTDEQRHYRRLRVYTQASLRNPQLVLRR